MILTTFNAHKCFTRYLPAFVFIFAIMHPNNSRANKPFLKFTKKTELQNLGVEAKLMPDTNEAPIPAPAVQTYRYKQKDGSGTRTWTEERYSPLELWRFDQFAGKWIDKYGNTLILSRIIKPFPSEIKKDKRISLKEFSNALDGSKDFTPEGKQLDEWIRNYTGAAIIAKNEIKLRNFSVKALVSHDLQIPEGNMLAYSFSLAPPFKLRNKAKHRHIFAIFILNPQIDKQSAQDAIEGSFFESMKPMWSAKAWQEQDPSDKFQQFEVSQDSNESDEFQESKKRAIASIRNMKDWWYVHTDDFVILSNISTQYRVMIKKLQEDLQLLRSAFIKTVKPTTEISAVSIIRIFGTEQQYAQYVGKSLLWTGGIWIPARRELIIRPLTWGSSDRKRKQFLRKIYHESFHQYLFYALDQKNTSPWFNEGHAVFFENSRIVQNQVEILEDEQKARIVEQAAKAPLGRLIRQLISYDYTAFYAPSGDIRERNYALAWAMIYYIHKSDPSNVPDRVKQLLPQYLKALEEGADMNSATAKVFNLDPASERGAEEQSSTSTTGSGFNEDFLDAFTEDFRDFWLNDTRRIKAKRRNLFK